MSLSYAGSGPRADGPSRQGMEWAFVVAGVQEGRWPDVRRRGSLLEPDQLGRHEVLAPVPPATRIAEERRLFYVAYPSPFAAGGDGRGGYRGEADQRPGFWPSLA